MEVTLNNGVTMPTLGLGVFQSPPEQATAAVEAALAAGYRHIDTAAYGNEREVGQGIRGSRLDRADLFIETKVWVSDYGYDQTLHAWRRPLASSASTTSTCSSCISRHPTGSTKPSPRTRPWRRCSPTDACGRSASATSCHTT